MVAKVQAVKIDMDRLGLAYGYALLVAGQFKEYDQIPDRLRRVDETQVDLKKMVSLQPAQHCTKDCPHGEELLVPSEQVVDSRKGGEGALLVAHHRGYHQVDSIFG